MGNREGLSEVTVRVRPRPKRVLDSGLSQADRPRPPQRRLATQTPSPSSGQADASLPSARLHRWHGNEGPRLPRDLCLQMSHNCKRLVPDSRRWHESFVSCFCWLLLSPHLFSCIISPVVFF